MHCLIENGTVVTVDVDKNIYHLAIASPDDIVFGDRYVGGEWIRCGERSKPMAIPLSEIREHAYQSMTHKEDSTPLIEWEGKAITVDQANKICLAYWIEDNLKADEMKALIIPAREYIRNLYLELEPELGPELEMDPEFDEEVA